MNWFRVFVLLLVLLVTTQALAEAHIYLEVSPSSGTMDDEFTMSVTVAGSSATDYPVLSGGEDFKLTLIGPETSVNIINGKISQQVRYVYRLIATKIGTLNTPSAEIEIAGQKLSAPPVPVSITGGHAPASANQDVFSRHTLSNEEVFVGQQVLETTEFYSSKAVTNLEIGDSTQDGFVSVTLGDPDKAIRNIDGQRFSVVSLKRALFPLRPGEQTILAPEIKGESREVKRPRPGSLFGGLDPFHDDLMQDFFGTVVSKPFSVRGPELRIRVAPLPPPPPGVTDPIVGTLAFSNTFQNAPIKTGESKTIEIEVRSTGNLNLLKSLPLEDNPSFKLYRESPSTRTRVTGGKLETTKTFRFSVVPLVAGHFVLPSIQIPYFNPATGQYETAITEEIAFEVLGENLATPAPTVDSRPFGARGNSLPEDVNLPLSSEIIGRSSNYLPITILLIIAVSLILILGCWWWLGKIKGPRLIDALRLVKAAEDAASLQSAFRFGLEIWSSRARLDTVKLANFSSDELRRWLKGKVSASNLFEAEVLLDELSYLSYGDPQVGSESEAFRSLKGRISDLLLKLPRQKGQIEPRQPD